MHIVIKASQQQKNELLSKTFPSTVQISWLNVDESTTENADVYFDLLFEEFGPAFSSITDKPVFVNAVLATCKELAENFIRINAWSGFLQRDILEIASTSTNKDKIQHIFKILNFKYVITPDEPGMIAARVIAMIINEAYFGLGDNISSKEEIDIAMKLGTNYPFGPFEWSEKIGLHRIYRLLKTLSQQDLRYLPAPAMEAELKAIA